MELGGIVTGDLSVRRLSSLVAGLPSEATTVRAVMGADALWGLPEHFLARILDALAAGNWQRSGGRGPRPKPVPRPGATDRTRYGRTTATREDVMAYLDQFKPIPEGEPDGR